MKVRFKFTKNGCLKFIGHLDVMRYFQKAMRRADIDICYSSGFSPHQIMSFAAPLGVGLTSSGEYFDIEANSVTSAEDMKTRLNAVMADGITIEEVRLLSDDCKNAMASVAAAGYTVYFRKGCEPAFSFEKSVKQFHAAEHVFYVKHTSKSEITLDLKKSVYDLRLNDNGSIYMLVDASSSGNVKPTMVMETLYGYADKTPGPFDFLIHREETYLRDAAGELAPLLSAGEAF